VGHGDSYPFVSYSEKGWQPQAKKIMIGHSNHPQGSRVGGLQLTSDGLLRSSSPWGLALILFVFLLFAMLAGMNSTEDDGSEHDFGFGLSGL
jgi:hypothetical protein